MRHSRSWWRASRMCSSVYFSLFLQEVGHPSDLHKESGPVLDLLDIYMGITKWEPILNQLARLSFWLNFIIDVSLALWLKIDKNTDKIAIQSFTVPRAREWAKWASERTSERSGGRERSEQSGASERVSGASERANGRASGPVLQSLFLTVIDHSEYVLFFPSYDMRVFHCRFRDLTPIGLVWTFPLPRRTFTSEQVYV